MQIPLYQQQTTANVRGNIAPAPNVQINNPSASATAQLGQAVGQVAGVQADNEIQKKQINVFNDYQAQVIDAAKVSSQAQLNWTKQFQDAQKSATGTASGFTEGFLKQYDDYTNQVLSQYNDPASKRLLGHELEQMRQQFGMQGIQFENKMFTNNQINSVTDMVKNHSAMLLENPDQYATFKAKTNAIIAASGLDEITQQQLQDQAQKSYTYAWANNLLQNNPQRGLNMLKPAVSQQLAGTQAGEIAAQSKDPIYNLAVMGIESGGKLNARNTESSAEGLYQMTDAVRKQYGLSSNASLADQVQAMNKLTSDNKNQLIANLGREPTYQELYLAHHFGATGATKILQSDRNTPIDQVVSKKAIEQNPELANKTVGEIINSNTQRFNKAAARYTDQQTAVISPAVSDMSPEQRVQYATRFQNEVDTRSQVQAVNLKSTMDNHVAMAQDGKMGFTPLTQDDFNMMYPKDSQKAQEVYSQYTGAIQTGRDINLVQNMSPEQENALINSYNSESVEGYADLSSRRDQLLKAIQLKRNAISKDPANWAMSNSSTVQSAYHQMQAGGDPNAYYSALIAEQQRQGVIQPKVLDKQTENNVIAQLSQTQGSQRAQLLTQLSKQYGNYWGQAAGQIQNSTAAPEGITAIMTAPTPAAQERAANLSSVDIKTLEASIPSTIKKADIDASVSQYLDDFKTSFPTYALGQKPITDVMQNITKAAYDNARSTNGSADVAAKLAVQQFINDKYNFNNYNGYNVRVPKSYDIDMVSKGLTNTAKNLTVDNIDTSNAHLLRSPWSLQDDASGYLNQVKDDGYWLTNNDEKGASLYFKGRNGVPYPVLDKNGKQITKSFAELNMGSK